MRVAWVTGASSGIGEALVHEFVRRGWRVVAFARREERLEALATQYPQKVLPYKGDVTELEDCENAVRAAVDRFGRLDAVIANAGISMRALAEEAQEAILQEVMTVNFWGAVRTIRAALPLIRAHRGWIVGVSSIAGFRGLPARSAYSASKFALNGFLEALRVELLPHGVHVLIAAPGFTQSEIRQKALTASGEIQAESPLPEEKLMSAAEVAQAIYRAMKRRRPYLVLTGEGRLVRWLNLLAPAWLDKMLYKRFTREPGSPLRG
jgi:NAD(P)-dependent dehydrogenase (short-subunit alcohol dehydrogenase family)